MRLINTTIRPEYYDADVLGQISTKTYHLIRRELNIIPFEEGVTAFIEDAIYEINI